MIDFGFDKLALIGAVALIVIGPERLPRVARTVGHFIGKAQRYVADVKAEVNRSIELEELKKMKGEFEDAARNVERSVNDEMRQTSSDFDQLWKDPADSASSCDADSPADRLGAAAAGIPQSEEELAPQARRHAAVVQAAPRRAQQGPVGRRPGGPLPSAAGAQLTCRPAARHADIR